MGTLLSGVLVISASPFAVGASLVLLASALLRNVGDDSG